ncbi:MAG: hypothetical protein ACO3QC_03585, partial [Phycisphaerales bacterium]
DVVFFGEMKVRLGETEAGVKVLGINAPYSVRLGHKGGEYDVPLLGRIDEKFLKPAIASLRSSGIGSGGSTGTSGASGTSALGGAAPGGLAGASGGRGTAADGAGRPGSASGAGGAGSAGSPSAGAPDSTAGAVRPTSIPSANPSANPVVAPGDEPGADQPSGPGPGEEPPSDAMKPLQPPPPGEEPASSGEGVEFVDRQLLPPPISEAEIGAMGTEQLRAALEAINFWDGKNVDDHSRARLDHERGLISQRLQSQGRP